MIYEVRTYDLQPQSLAEVEKRFGEAYEYRKKVSPLAAFFHTEIGPLNQIIHIWPYKDMAERDRLRAEALKACDGHWPPKTAEFIMAQRTDIFHAFPFSPEIKPGKQGPFFEMRTYTVANHGEMAKMEAMWAAALPERLKIGPVTAKISSMHAVSRHAAALAASRRSEQGRERRTVDQGPVRGVAVQVQRIAADAVAVRLAREQLGLRLVGQVGDVDDVARDQGVDHVLEHAHEVGVQAREIAVSVGTGDASAMRAGHAVSSAGRART